MDPDSIMMPSMSETKAADETVGVDDVDIEMAATGPFLDEHSLWDCCLVLPVERKSMLSAGCLAGSKKEQDKKEKKAKKKEYKRAMRAKRAMLAKRAAAASGHAEQDATKIVRQNSLHSKFDADEDEEEDAEEARVEALGETATEATDEMQYFEKLIRRINKAGLEYASYYSIGKDEIYIKIRCPEVRLEAQADITNFTMPLDELKLDVAIRAGFPLLNIDPINLSTTCDGVPISKFRPCEHIHAKYERDPNIASLYKMRREGSPFGSMDRIKLVTNILQEGQRMGGCYIKLSKRVFKGELLAYMPMHDAKERQQLYAVWMHQPLLSDPRNMPFDAYKEYFGESSALYMVFLGQTAFMYGILSVFGIALQVAMLSRRDTLMQTYQDSAIGVLRAAYAVVLCLWCACVSANWQHKQKFYSLKWGMTGFESEEDARPQFSGTAMNSPVTGKPEVYFPARLRTARIVLGATVSGTIIAAVFVFVLVVVPLCSEVSGTFGAVVNAVGVQVFRAVYCNVAIKLTDAENWRTETVYADKLTMKLFFFNFVNAYGTLLLSLIGYNCQRRLDQVDDDEIYPQKLQGYCLYYMYTTLIITQIVTLVTTTAVNTLVPIVSRVYNRYSEGGFDQHCSQCETQYFLVEFDETLDAIQLYTATSIQYGYVALFSAAAPVTSVIACVANVALMRLDAYKFLTGFRRIEPRGAEDIGVFEHIYKILGAFAIVTNSAIVIFLTYPFMRFKNEQVQDNFWMSSCFTLFVVTYVFLHATSDVHHDVALQLERQDFIRSKVVDKIADEDEKIVIQEREPVLSIRYKDDEAYNQPQ